MGGGGGKHAPVFHLLIYTGLAKKSGTYFPSNGSSSAQCI